MSIASEKRQRRLAQTITGDDLVAEKGDLRTKGKKSERFLLCTTLTLLRKWLILLTNMRGRGNDLKALCNYLVSKNGL